MSAIDIFTFIGSNSSDYAIFMRKTMLEYASEIHDLRFKSIHTEGYDSPIHGFAKVTDVKSYHHSSLTHGMAMNTAIQYISGDADFVIFCDADIAVLYSDWDSYLVKMLQEYEYLAWELSNNRPGIFFIAFKTPIIKNAIIDFRPYVIDGRDSVRKFKIDCHAIGALAGCDIGNAIKADTGWRVGMDMKLQGYRGYVLPRVPATSAMHVLPYINNDDKEYCNLKPGHMDEWHIGSRIFGTHKQASRNHPLNGEYGMMWKSRIEKYMKEDR